jgi:hypothetical protein
MFREQKERCLRLEDSGSRICDLILRPAGDRVCLAVHLEEAVRRLQVMQVEHREVVAELKALCWGHGSEASC